MEERHIGVLLKMITDKMKCGADADFKKFDITFSQSRVFLYLSGHSDVTQKDLEEYLCVSHPTIVGIVTRMEKNGYVRSWLNPQDKRNKMVCLTDRALAQLAEMEQVTSQRESRLIAGLSDRQITELKKTLLLIYQNIS